MNYTVRFPGTSNGRPAMGSLTRDQWRVVLFCALLAVYLVLTLGIIFRSPLLTLDTYLSNMHFRRRFPEWRPVVYYYVMFGQRGPATLTFLPFFVWATWKRRSTSPLVHLVTALVLLNLSVGVVKYTTGRLGPRAHTGASVAHTVGAHDIFAGGDIYPSGHVSNAVVLYGLIAIIAVSHRRLLAWIAVFLSVTVGLGTVFLDTHWFSDVLGGWLAGGLVLIALPWATPTVQRWADFLEARLRRRLARRRSTRPAAVHVARHRAPGPRPVPLPERAAVGVGDGTVDRSPTLR